MPYATVAHVKARAGFLAEAWGESTDVSETDVQVFLQQISDEISAAVVGRGLAIPAAGSIAAKALAGLNADGALLLALDATFPAGEGPAAATELQESVRTRYEAAWAALVDGKHPATTAPVAAGEQGAGEMSDFWSNNPYYGIEGYLSPAEALCPNPYLDPAARRGEPW